MNKTQKKGSKIFWYILFAIITIVLCYMFTVVYFYFIAPYNITLKLTLWPFVSDQTVGEMYLDASVQIDFKVNENGSFEEVTKSVVGVNIREDGYVVAPWSDFKDCNNETQFKILSNYGKVFSGKLLFLEKDYNIAILKCESLEGPFEKLAIPYVNIGTMEPNFFVGTDILAVSSPLKSKTVWSGFINPDSQTNVYETVAVENKNAVNFVVENCYTVTLESSSAFTGGAVFDKGGSLLGLSYDKTLDDGNYVSMPVDCVNLFLENIVKNYDINTTYTSPLAEGLDGFDKIDLSCNIDTSKMNVGFEEYFYHSNSWKPYTEDIISYANSDVTGYYLLSDWRYGEQTILKSSDVIVAVKTYKKTTEIKTKTDLLNLIYTMKTGASVSISYYEIGLLGSTFKTVSFTVV